MGISPERIQRDDMYSLQRAGLEIDPDVIEGKRLGKMDGPHVFFDGGDQMPTSLLKAKNNRKIGLFKGKSFKYGPCHSHDLEHSCHILETMTVVPKKTIHKFRTRVKEFRKTRKASRDR